MVKIIILLNFLFLACPAKEFKCGYHIFDKILNGDYAALDEFPWMARLGYMYINGLPAGFRCGGTLISKKHILTAAHCITAQMSNGVYLKFVQLGEFDITKDQDCTEFIGYRDCADPPINVEISYIKTHPLFHNVYNDIAIVGLNTEVKFSDFIRPICIPQTANLFAGQKVYVSGWGETENANHSNVKLKVEIPLVGIEKCKTKFKQIGTYLQNQLHLCAGGEQGKDACRGDSGGPLMAPDSNGQWTIYGITSGGHKCGQKSWPGLYTRVATFHRWIRENML